MSAEQALDEALARSQPAKRWVRSTRRRLKLHGFERDNSYAATGLCRDELCTPFERAVDRTWGESFNCTALAGLPTLGRTGFRTLAGHAPAGDRPRFVLYFLAHIAVDHAGTPGRCARPHRHGHACGALNAYLGELHRGDIELKMDGHDPEYSLLRFRMSRALGDKKPRDIWTLTQFALMAIQQDVQRLVGELPQHADIALFTGTLVHTPDEDRVIPAQCNARIDGKVLSLS